jgi:hypothetical protein
LESSLAGTPACKEKAAATATTVGVAKYRDPQTGKTWTGSGKPRNWIVGVKDREAFLIGAGSGSGMSTTGSKRVGPAEARGDKRGATSRGGRRRKAAKKASRAARQAALAPAVQVESGAGTA